MGKTRARTISDRGRTGKGVGGGGGLEGEGAGRESQRGSKCHFFGR